MPPKIDNHSVAGSLRELAGALREDVERILANIRYIEKTAEVLERGDGAITAARRGQVIDATACHSLNCVIKSGWAAKALTMYREALEA